MDKNLKKFFIKITPGTELRDGINNILDAGTGALIVLDEGDKLEKSNIIDGGFEINCDFTPQRLHELCKMDGAIILDSTASKIKYANVHLQPDNSYETNESGTRHRSAERVARQTDNLVITISERRNRITIYKGNFKYKLKKLSDVMMEGTQAMSTFERYKNILDKALQNITLLEFDGMVTLGDVVTVIQRFEMLERIKREVERALLELGGEGRFIAIQLEELFKGVPREEECFIKDYLLDNGNIVEKEIKIKLGKLGDLELLDVSNIIEILGYGKSVTLLDKEVESKGRRILSKITRITKRDIDRIVEEYGKFTAIVEATQKELMEIKGISTIKAKSIKKGLERLKVTAEWEK